jgi:hypothetical protein
MERIYCNYILLLALVPLAFGIICGSAAIQNEVSAQSGSGVQMESTYQGAFCRGFYTDTLYDSLNCGGCGDYCAPGSICNNGACTCFRELDSCNGTCVSTKFDDKNCGTCGNRCPPGTTCLDGTCSCPQLTTPCNGECVNMRDDNNNCGWCGHVCPHGKVCYGGACIDPRESRD